MTGCHSSSHPAKDADARLSALAVSAGMLTPAFDASVTSYSLTVAASVTSTTVTPTVQSSRSTVTVKGTGVASGSASGALALIVGDNLIPVVVTAESGATKTYTVNVKVVQDADASMVGLSPSTGLLTPAFDSDVHAYTVDLYSGPSSLTIRPMLASAKATVTVNGVPVASGATSAAIPLSVGQTPIQVVVTAENGSSVTTTVTVIKRTPSTPVWVLDSSNGSPVPGTMLSVLDSAGKMLESCIPVGAKGTVTLGLDPTKKYILRAKGTGSAQASFVNFDPSKESSANLYCHPLGMINFPAEAPQITQLSYSADGTTWTPVSNNQITDTLAHIAYLKVTAIGKAGISSTAWSGFGIGTNVDRPAWAWDYVPASAIDENSVATQVEGLPYYQSTSEFALTLNNFLAGNSHYIDVVAYDVANNRTEQRVYITVNDAVTYAADPDISAVAPSAMIVQLGTYGLTRDVFAVTPVDQKNITYSAIIQFNVGSGASAPGIRGFEVYRSADGTNFKKVVTNLYGTLYKGSSGVYSCYDLDPSLQEGVTYTYKVKAFNGNLTSNGGYTPESVLVAAQYLPPYTVSLAAPATYAVSQSRQPTFKFGISNPALFDPAVSDYFRFYLFIKDKVGTSIYGQAYRYNFLTAKFEKLVGASYVDATSEVSISADHATVSIIYPNATTLMPGITYEWSIFGTKGSASYSTSDASSFLKYYGTDTAGRALSYGSTYEKSYGAINGFFTLTIDPNAQ
ncbi:cadherin-like beta sandwich domain-containing protein [Geothrix sp. 21YS21S-4]|uniref:cadherin-like beta sandwich domain-containing protein n=1 Tax=Geothrix sp. 21YS21S-4 TaxID=3068889 RepID=UPI0027BA117E|nr:cadherin-like beta sandwich domain-containing protein [Geothrix sp. 21YS21S-4]